MGHKSIVVKPHSPQAKFDARQKIVEALNLDNDFISKNAKVTLCSAKYVHIENYKKIINISIDQIIVCDRKYKIIISGESLSIRYFFDGAIDITGIIYSLKYERIVR